MSIPKENFGFTVLELLLVLVIAGLIGLVGYKIYNTNSETDKTLRSTEDVLDHTPQSTVSVPVSINSTSDLDQAEKALADYDSSSADNEDLGQLDSQLSAF